MQYLFISEELAEAIRDALVTRPYSEVAGLIRQIDALEVAGNDEREPVVSEGPAPEPPRTETYGPPRWCGQAEDAPIEGDLS